MKPKSNVVQVFSHLTVLVSLRGQFFSPILVPVDGQVTYTYTYTHTHTRGLYVTTGTKQKAESTGNYSRTQKIPENLNMMLAHCCKTYCMADDFLNKQKGEMEA